MERLVRLEKYVEISENRARDQDTAASFVSSCVTNTSIGADPLAVELRVEAAKTRLDLYR
jgi:hypothetical protein